MATPTAAEVAAEAMALMAEMALSTLLRELAVAVVAAVMAAEAEILLLSVAAVAVAMAHVAAMDRGHDFMKMFCRMPAVAVVVTSAETAAMD